MALDGGAFTAQRVVLTFDVAFGVVRLELVDLFFDLLGNLIVVAVVVVRADDVVVLFALGRVGLGLAVVAGGLEVGHGGGHGGRVGAVDLPALGVREAGALRPLHLGVGVIFLAEKGSDRRRGIRRAVRGHGLGREEDEGGAEGGKDLADAEAGGHGEGSWWRVEARSGATT